MNTLTAVISGRRKLMLVELVAKVVLAFAIGLATSIALAGIVLLLAHDAQAAELQAMKPKEVQQGTLLLKSEGATLAVPAVATDAEIKVSGIVARAVVKQTYRNPYDTWFEGLYVFPLPENAAVDHLRMKVGDRIIEGDIQERQAARAQYEQAKSSGRRAALVEQERPNLFTTSVANIPPRGEIVVEIEYQQTLRYDSGSFSLRFPMVVGPRYIPGAPAEGQGAGKGWSPNTDQVPDASRITPPVLDPAKHAPTNPVRLKVVLDAGVPLARVDSPYHAIVQRETEGGGGIVELAEGSVPANKDFELTWTPAASHAPQAALFTEQLGDKRYALLMVMPPAKEVAAARLPREVVFVIDTSGSMSGSSIAQARDALELAIARLSERDSFNVVEFNSYAKALYDDARPASAANRDNAVRWVRRLQAQGGTEMALALNLALNGRENPGRVRQVIFLTDGAVGNEDGLFKLIRDKLGDSRLFTVGIGSAPNSHFMSKAAQTGRGSFTYIGKIEEVKEKMGQLFAKLESPVLKGVDIAWPGAVEAWPKRVPDLYLGEPIVVSAEFDKLDGDIKLSGLRGDTPWSATLPVATAREGRGMGVLWAREKIASLIDSQRDGAKEEDVRDAVVEVALAHHLVSKYTSLVAVDKTPVRPKEDELQSGAIPTNLPEGWEYGKVFGELPQGATDSLWNLLAGCLTLLLAIGLTITARRTPVALRRA
ncbi:MAG: marine proteobacterial sortase target protein [Rhodocyclaceae bacterium]|uniref:Marine proteobacterial sortase target protein n=1 Tax=Candidatus Desulfobacillus denitrificans TaxID=2608985 RepID=A0A809S7L2_9PROT|nr:marine proteobacterial sortase target protein [Candidatus Desulfobacillus denitrificans]GIK45520.1 MAG: marine proteobacterial sortase target protein [Betaproteobacteria bacterium]GJQ54460.1 MAG: marine proteobacterial sortase target protein [Rhodocyclaceae bacterium]